MRKNTDQKNSEYKHFARSLSKKSAKEKVLFWKFVEMFDQRLFLQSISKC